MSEMNDMIIRLENMQVRYNQSDGDYFEGMSDAYEEIIEMLKNEFGDEK